MNTVKSRLFSLADLKEFISLDVEEDYPKMLKKKTKTGRYGPRAIPVLSEESWRKDFFFQTEGKYIYSIEYGLVSWQKS